MFESAIGRLKVFNPNGGNPQGISEEIDMDGMANYVYQCLFLENGSKEFEREIRSKRVSEKRTGRIRIDEFSPPIADNILEKKSGRESEDSQDFVE